MLVAVDRYLLSLYNNSFLNDFNWDFLSNGLFILHKNLFRDHYLLLNCDIDYFLDWDLYYFFNNARSFDNSFNGRHLDGNFNSNFNYSLYYLRNFHYFLNYSWHHYYFLNYFFNCHCFRHLDYLLDDFFLDFYFSSDPLLDDRDRNGVFFFYIDGNFLFDVVRDTDRHFNRFLNSHDEGFHDLDGNMNLFIDSGDDGDRVDLFYNINMFNKERFVDIPINNFLDLYCFRYILCLMYNFWRLWNRNKDLLFHRWHFNKAINNCFNRDYFLDYSVNGYNLFFCLDGLN